MADAKRCDRCSAYYIEGEKEFKIKGTIIKNVGFFGHVNSLLCRFDLCDNCAEDLVSFMESPELWKKEKTKEELESERRIQRAKRGYISSDVVMSEYLRICGIPLTVEEKRLLLEYAGEDDYMDVLDTGEIVPKKGD